MSTKEVVNIYGVINGELERMHSQLSMYLKLPNPENTMANASVLYKRIVELQEIVIAEFKGADKKIQDAIAEVAFTTKE
jgi:hypothetical protein